MVNQPLDQAASLRRHQTNAEISPQLAKKSINCIAVASGKGGVGKTFVSVNLCVALAQAHQKVLLVDADLGLANADIVLGITPTYTLKDVIFHGKSFQDVVVSTPYGVDLLPASSGSREMVNLGEARMALFLKQLLHFSIQYDTIVFDCASGINTSVTCFLKAAPLNLIVATPSPTSIMDVYALIKVIHQQGTIEPPVLVINMVDNIEQGKKVYHALNQVARRYLSSQMRLLGIIPNDQEIPKSLTKRQPFLSYATEHPISEYFRQMAKNILNWKDTTKKVEDLNFQVIAEGLVAERQKKDKPS